MMPSLLSSVSARAILAPMPEPQDMRAPPPKRERKSYQTAPAGARENARRLKQLFCTELKRAISSARGHEEAEEARQAWRDMKAAPAWAVMELLQKIEAKRKRIAVRIAAKSSPGMTI